ncbi:MAG: signal peptide peptidase SppA [Pirellulales bacterium]|nr:signal peptide peptidase SppA [Pirellulales bacterium]
MKSSPQSIRRIIGICSVVLAMHAYHPNKACAAESPDQKAETSEKLRFAVLSVQGQLNEGAEAAVPFGGSQTNLGKLIKRIDQAAADDELVGLILKIRSPSIGRAKIDELRTAIKRVRDAKKKVYADLQMATTSDYLIASACDEIVMPPAASLIVTGVRIEVTFYKKMLQKIGAKADIMQVGDFKGAGETYTRSEMSPELKKQYESLATDFYDQILTTIARDRNLPRERVIELIDKGLYMAGDAKQKGLIDRVAYQTDWDTFLKKTASTDGEVELLDRYGEKQIDTDFSGFAGMMKFMNLLMGQSNKTKSTAEPQIAVVYVVGAIVPGKSTNTLMGNSIVGSETIINAIRSAEKNERVKAIVLRVDSPGGSALASDLIWNEIRKCEKPVIASMGDVAASGGYYVAMGAKQIFADEGTLTGSIGVVGGKVALEDTFHKLGITTDIVSRGKNSGVFSLLQPFSESERQALGAMMKNIYEQFVSKAALSRGMDQKQMDPLAEGKVYTGRQAKTLGLVDELGGLHEAILAAKKSAGLKAEDQIDLLPLPRRKTFFEELLDTESINSQSPQISLKNISLPWTQLLAEVEILSLVFRHPVQTILPCQISIH